MYKVTADFTDGTDYIRQQFNELYEFIITTDFTDDTDFKKN